MRLAHVADIHPNSNATFAGSVAIDPTTGKNVALTDLRKSLEFVYGTVRDLQCDAVLIPGDVFDSVKPTMDEVAVILEWIELLAEETEIVVIPGNHDMAVSPNMATALEPLRWRRSVHLALSPCSFVLNLQDQLVRFHGLPYPTKGRLLEQAAMADKSPEETTAIINHALGSILRGFRADFGNEEFNVLLAHGSVAHCTVGDQPRSLAHDILLPVDEFAGFDYCALGHIHQHQRVAENAWYSGSLMRNGFGEEREPKGFNLVEIERGQPPKVTFIENPHARVYATINAEHLHAHVDALGLDNETVWRFKDTLTEGDCQAVKPILHRLQNTTRFFQMDVELVRADRARDAEMAQCLTTEAALARVLDASVSAQDRQAIVAKHTQLLEEVTT